ncbi:hypothetical protein D3C77_481690 [compost metagenome]|jgi:hypothetical protein|nr:DUF3077 domain-containing protein [Pseudomonas sp.]
MSGTTVGVAGFINGTQPPVELFRINAGIPCDYALEQASLVLKCVHTLILSGVLDEDGELMWAAYYLSGFAKAIIDDVVLAAGKA